ncbi:MAG: hypothetical protein KAQ98_08930 [Bacteriovoracaceae bacterium]|nr:hypothetical protein [Bacteriovoracaceae bacterium]
MIVKRLVSTIIIFVVSFELALATTVVNLAHSRSIASNKENGIEKLLLDMKEFKVSILGEEKDCEENKEDVISKEAEEILQDSDDSEVDIDIVKFEEQVKKLEEDILRETRGAYIQKRKDEVKNACNLGHKIFDKQPEKKKCKQKIEGLIDKIVRKIMQDEKDEVEPVKFRIHDKDVSELFKKAESFHLALKEILFMSNIENDKRREILIEYLGSVVWPVRDLIVVKRAYVKNEYDGSFFYKELLPTFPTQLCPEDDLEMRDVLLSGPNPGVEPFHFRLVSAGWGRTKIVFNPIEAVARDLTTILKAPTARNYIRASKWMTLQMMMSQIIVYNKIIGETGPPVSKKVHNACKGYLNGDFNGKLMLENMDTGGKKIDGDVIMDNILESHALVVSPQNQNYYEYYLENVNKDPTKYGYSGLAPFEAFKIAKVGMENKTHGRYLEPAIDDYFNYQDVLEAKMPKAHSHLYGAQKDKKTGKMKMYSYSSKETFDKIMGLPSERISRKVLLKDGKIVMIDAMRQNLSEYLAQRMQHEGVVYFEDVIPDSIKKKLKGNHIKIDFPSLYSASIWRNWSVSVLIETLEKISNENKLNENVQFVFRSMCHRLVDSVDPILRSDMNSICSKNIMSGSEKYTKKIIEHVLSVLYRHMTENRYVPGRRIREIDYEKIWPALGHLWSRLHNETSFIPRAQISEYKYLVQQMNSFNPWARMRLGYLLAMDDLEKQRKEFFDGNGDYNKFAGGDNCGDNRDCFLKNMKVKISTLEKAGQEIGLHKTLRPMFVNSLLKKKEKIQIWKKYIDKVHKNNARLFAVEDDKGNDYYQYLEDLSYHTMLNEQHVFTYVRERLDKPLSDKRKDEIYEVLETPMGRATKDLFELYTSSGDVEKQTRLMNEFLMSHKSMDISPKLNFLLMDSELKRPIFKDVMEQAARARKDDVENKMVSFCNLEPDDHEKLQTLFYSTANAQNGLNRMMGLPGVPENVMNKIQEMSAEEAEDIFIGLGLMAMIMFTVVVSTSCTAVSGGFCAPLAVGMVGAAMKGYQLQMNLFERELGRYVRGKKYGSDVKKMEELGFSEIDNHKKMERTWFWTALEASGLLAFIGPLVRSTTLGTKFLYLTGKNVMKRGGKEAFKALARGAVKEVDTKYALYVLEYGSLGDDIGARAFKVTMKRNYRQAQKALKEFHEGRIGLKKLLGRFSSLAKPFAAVPKQWKKSFKKGMIDDVMVRMSEDHINKRTAKVVAGYWNNNPKTFLANIRSYTEGSMFRKSLVKAEKHIGKIKTKTARASWIPGRGWYSKLRYGALVENAEKIRKIEKGLVELVKRGGNLEEFVLKNMDDLSDIFSKIPVRKRELVYLFLLQGGPHVGGMMAGARIPILGQLADGILLRKIFNSRNRLCIETATRKARAILGLKKIVASETALRSFMAFKNSVKEAIAGEADKKAANKLKTLYKNFEDELTDKIYGHLKGKMGKKSIKLSEGKKIKLGEHVFKMNKDLVRRIIFKNARSLEERALAEAIWSNVPLDDLYGTKNLGKLAHHVVKKLSNYKNIDEFERFLNALKVISLNNTEVLVEFM